MSGWHTAMALTLPAPEIAWPIFVVLVVRAYFRKWERRGVGGAVDETLCSSSVDGRLYGIGLSGIELFRIGLTRIELSNAAMVYAG
jgi:hypothetical protein